MPVELAPNQQLNSYEKLVEYPSWWGEDLFKLMEAIEVRVHNRSLMKRGNTPRRGSTRLKRTYIPNLDSGSTVIPYGLPEDLIAQSVLESFDVLTREDLNLAAPLNLPASIDTIFPVKETDRYPRWSLRQYEKGKASRERKGKGKKGKGRVDPDEIEVDGEQSSEDSLFDGDDDDTDMSNFAS
jgi:hypothetical protein